MLWKEMTEPVSLDEELQPTAFGPRGLLDTSDKNPKIAMADTGGHDFRFTSKICDGRTGRCDIRKTNSEVCVLPGGESLAPIKSGEKYQAKPFQNGFPGFPVITTQTGPNSFRNTAQPGHIFSGTIDRDFTQTPDGSIYATTTGKGNAGNRVTDALNDMAGPIIFEKQNQLCAEGAFGNGPFTTIPLPFRF